LEMGGDYLKHGYEPSSCLRHGCLFYAVLPLAHLLKLGVIIKRGCWVVASTTVNSNTRNAEIKNVTFQNSCSIANIYNKRVFSIALMVVII